MSVLHLTVIIVHGQRNDVYGSNTVELQVLKEVFSYLCDVHCAVSTPQ